jgi:FkbM family methyltransferase
MHHTLMPKLSRLFHFATRFAACGEKLGWGVAFKAYVVARFLHRPVVIRLRGAGTDFHLRGGTTDLGSLSSFYQGYPHVQGPLIRTILDGGAYNGDSAVIFAWKCRPELIVACEPDAENFRLLKLNTAAWPSVVALHCALWSHDTTVNLNGVANSKVGGSVTTSEASGAVRARAIAGLAQEFNLAGFDLVKLDIEGAEREILQSEPAAWLKHCRVFILELHDNLAPGAGTALWRAINECGPFRVNNIGEHLVFLRADLADELRPIYEL